MQWEEVRQWLAGWAMNAVIIFLAVAPLPGQLATHAYQVSYLLSALFFLVLLARRRFPAVIIVAFAGRAVLAAFPPYGGSPIAVFGQVLVMFVIAGAARPEWVAWAGWAAGLVMIAVREITGQPRADYGWSDVGGLQRVVRGGVAGQPPYPGPQADGRAGETSGVCPGAVSGRGRRRRADQDYP
jgi:hypothetical protein